MVSEARSNALMTLENMVLVLQLFMLRCSVKSERIGRSNEDNHKPASISDHVNIE